MPRFSHGLVVGKFAPRHAGHEHVIRTALEQGERVSVWCYARPDFPSMPSPLRRGWLRAVFPAHLYPQLTLLPDAPNPPLDSADAATHNAYCKGVLDGWNVHPDAVFTSEDYGEDFAAALGATQRRVDSARTLFPVSSTALRQDVHALRHFLNPLVYTHFVQRVVILGAESTGKSTLTAALGEAFGTAWVREYGRDVYEREDGALHPDHFLEIALGHRALEREAAVSGRAHRYVFSDTHAATTLMWSYLLTGTALPELHALGLLYENGEGVTQNAATAAGWYRRAANQGYARAQHALGNLYLYGDGVKADPVQAMTWYRKAADQGYARGQNSVGYLYETGSGVKADPKQAAVWYRKAADQGNTTAQNNLGDLYEAGSGVARNYTVAVSWYRRAADQQDARGQDNLGYMCERGEGVSKDLKAAVGWYRKAADQGHTLGLYHLGLMCQAGRGTGKDLKTAFARFQKSAAKGFAPAQTSLGLMYKTGSGTPRDLKLAAEWFRKAAASGNAAAKAELKNLGY